MQVDSKGQLPCGGVNAAKSGWKTSPRSPLTGTPGVQSGQPQESDSIETCSPD